MLGALTSGALISNVVEVTFDPKVKWYMTGLDFQGQPSRRMRMKVVEAAQPELAKACTYLLPQTVIFHRELSFGKGHLLSEPTPCCQVCLYPGVGCVKRRVPLVLFLARLTDLDFRSIFFSRTSSISVFGLFLFLWFVFWSKIK